MSGLVLRGKLRRVRTKNHSFSPEPEPAKIPVRRPAYVARMLAVAHHLRDAFDAGRLASTTQIGRGLRVTATRITQVVRLTYLAPDIQEEVLFLEAFDGVEPVSEYRLHDLASILSWEKQRDVWRREVRPPVARTDTTCHNITRNE